MTTGIPDTTSLSSLPEALRTFHHHLPLAGAPPNALLTISNDQLIWLVSAIRDTPVPVTERPLDEWRTLLSLLKPHWIFALLSSHVRTWPADCRPPAEVMAFLEGGLLQAGARSLVAGRQIQRIAGTLQDAGIPVLLLKGPALARTLYPDMALRQSSDIDLLVQPQNIPATEDILGTLGYSCPDRIFRTSRHSCHHETFLPGGPGIPVELHWEADNAYNLFPDGWLDAAFSRRIPIPPAGTCSSPHSGWVGRCGARR